MKFTLGLKNKIITLPRGYATEEEIKATFSS